MAEPGLQVQGIPAPPTPPTRDSGSGRQFKPQIYQGKGRGQNRGNYDRCNYNQ